MSVVGLSDGRAGADQRRSTCRAVRAAPGVVDVLTAEDIPGENDVSPTGMHDDPVLRRGKVQFHGQPIFAVMAETRERHARAARLAKIEYEELPAIIDVDDALAAASRCAAAD